MPKRLLLAAVFLVIACLMAAAFRYQQTLNVTGQTTPFVKNQAGKPARVWWWKPRVGPAAVIGTSRAGEGGSVWNSQWMVGRWLLVAELGPPPTGNTRPEDEVKVYLLAPDPAQYSSNDSTYLAPRAELTATRPWWPPGHRAESEEEEF